MGDILRAMSEEKPEFPRWCDLRCPHAGFPKEEGLDGSGSCRTFLALHCSYLDEVVTKNAPCAARQREG
jgi:hypothetical protein